MSRRRLSVWWPVVTAAILAVAIAGALAGGGRFGWVAVVLTAVALALEVWLRQPAPPA